MKPEIAQFTRQRPVTKLELWQCFRRSHAGFTTVQVDAAHSVIGKNAPRYMEAKGYLVKTSTPRGDFYSVTGDGQEWLTNGIKAYIKNHPSARSEVTFLPGDPPPTNRIRRLRKPL